MKDTKTMFLESYNLYSDEVFRFALFKLSDREKAKDVAQEAFMKMWLYLSKGNEIKNARAFLYKIAGNLVIDEYRKTNRRDGRTQSLDTLSDLGYDVAFDDTASWADKIDGAQALALLQELPDVYAEVLFLKYVEEKTILEIGEITGDTDNAISVRINRGMKKLKDIILAKQKK